jgi:hypothetical protein
MAFWSFIIPILVDLLVKFLIGLFSKGEPAQTSRDARGAFLSSVRRRFWLGPHRMAWAGALYDRAAAKMYHTSFGGLAPVNRASLATEGLASLKPDDLEPRMLSATAHNFKILPVGLVQGGSASYLLNEVSGEITYRASIKVGKWFFSKTYEKSGKYSVVLALLSSDGFEFGKKISIGPLRMLVDKVLPASVRVSLLIDGQDAAGFATVMTDGKFAELRTLDADVTVSGFALKILVRPA